MYKWIAKILLASLVFVVVSCTENGDENPILTDNFDRAEMLEFWADEVIIPAYLAYNNSIKSLATTTDGFYVDPSVTRLSDLRAAWLDAYLLWQKASMFEIGMAEEIGLRNFTNIYPTNVDLIHDNIDGGTYNLELPSNFAAQGFPALDYLLYGQADNDEEIISALIATEVKNYFSDLVSRMDNLSAEVLDDWNQGFRSEFIANSGSSATASTDKIVNALLFYYERHLRAAKVGIPAGIFSGNEEPGLVEGKYSDIYSKELFSAGFAAVRSLFSGQSYDGLKSGVSLQQYLDEVHTTNNTATDISAAINAQWENVVLALEQVEASFESQIIQDNMKMLALYDELQKAVVPLKVDMLQALNIQVDFVDADGD